MEYGPAPESAAEADKWLDGHDRRFGLYIGGEWHGAGQTFASFNPATARPLAEITQAVASDVDAAVAAARAAQAAWAKLAGHARARYLYALARLVQRHARLLAVLETLDNGKPIREARDIDIPLVARHFYYHAGWAQIVDQEFPDHIALGTAGQIIPWNFPLLMLAWKIAPALATGNTVVLKPAEQTSLTALLFAELCHQAGLPPGVVNIVTGDGAVGELITANPDIDKIAFTGSTEVGRKIRQITAGSGKKLSLELGGKSPFIVFDDADLDSAVEGLVDAIWFNQGQVCCAGSRLLVQESIAEPFLAKTRARMEKLVVSDPMDKGSDIGAIVSAEQLARIRDLVQAGEREGATIWQPEGTGPAGASPAEGWYYPPTLVTDVAPVAGIAQEEIFGPVLTAMSFRTPAEAVALANNSRYGLAASVWSENINLALDIAPKLAAGSVWINSANLFDASCGFGGVGDSGFGREGGREGLVEYLRPSWQAKLPPYPTPGTAPEPSAAQPDALGPGAELPLDRTAKLYIGGKQKRPDSGYSAPVCAPEGRLLGEVGTGSRKDIREAVEAARKAAGWSVASAHNRAQVLYYIGENLEARASEFRARLMAMTGASPRQAARQLRASVARLFAAAAWADKYEGAVHQPPLRGIALALNEPVGVIGMACPDEQPLLAFLSLAAPALAMGNRVVAIPSERHPLSAADLYQVLDTSDLPGGALNIVTGRRNELAQVLAEHDDVDALWYFGPATAGAAMERAAAANLKRVWSNHGRKYDWFSDQQAEGREVLRHAVAVKNVWAPYGE